MVTPTPAAWYASLAAFAGRGSTTVRTAVLGDLHAQRREHEGQFFTPLAVSALMWKLLEPAFAEHPERRIHLFDNAVGSGRLFAFADPERHTLAGVDVDTPLVNALARHAKQAGFACEFLDVSLAELGHPSRDFDVALINPPFSLTLDSPHLRPYPGTHWGRFGPHSRCLSHIYALHQALDFAHIVLAVLPRPFAQELLRARESYPRLLAVLQLPGDAFASSATQVAVSIAVFGREPRTGEVQELRLSADSELPRLPLQLPERQHETPSLRVRTVEDSKPAITLPVTGNKHVYVAHDGRRIVLKFSCGLTQAKVLNAIFEGPLPPPQEEQRYPRGLRFTGELKLDIEVHLLQADALASLQALIAQIRAAGGEPTVAPGFWQYVKRRMRRLERSLTPFYRCVPADTAQLQTELRLRPRRTRPIDATRWGSPILHAEKTYVARAAATPGTFTLTLAGRDYTLSEDEIAEQFFSENATNNPSHASIDWQQLFTGKAAKFFPIAEGLRAQARRYGLDRWLDWDYQFHDLIEAAVNPRGAMIGWEPGMGKARLAVCLALIFGTKRNLIVLEAGLLGEFLRELATINLDPALWQVLEKPAQLQSLKQINLISYERLRSPIVRGAGRRTWARCLRRRCAVVVCDESDHLAHLDTAQTAAAWMLCAKRRYPLTGTPVPNYPRDLLPVLAWAIGDGTAAQAYGYRRAHLEPRLITSAQHAHRGIDVFRERFVTTQWVTNEFAEKMTEGAKREIPKLANLPLFREFHAPHLLRRIVHEPDCARYLPIPTPERVIRSIEWDDAHLAHYLKVAEEFANWYSHELAAARAAGRKLNMLVVLARIEAVFNAANQPHEPSRRNPLYLPLTSKQRYAIERLCTLTAEGHKSILYARSPGLLRRLASELNARGVDNVVYDGTSPPAKRIVLLDDGFRFGPVPVLLASLGVTQKGLNIPQADRVLFYNRAWTHKTEKQAGDRVLRPQQKRKVLFEFLELLGSIDTYMGQMVLHKQDASDAGIDWHLPEYESVDFLHLDTLLGRFCEELAELRGIKRADLRKQLELI